MEERGGCEEPGLRQGGEMKIGFYTSTFNDRPLEEVLDFAKGAGFDAIELDVGGHIKTPDNVAAAVAKARERGLFVSSITFIGNQLDPDAGKRKELRARTADVRRGRGRGERADPGDLPRAATSTMSEDDNYKGFAELA